MTHRCCECGSDNCVCEDEVFREGDMRWAEGGIEVFRDKHWEKFEKHGQLYMGCPPEWQAPAIFQLDQHKIGQIFRIDHLHCEHTV